MFKEESMMNMMKLLTVLALTLLLCGCGAKAEPVQTTAPTTAPTAQSVPPTEETPAQTEPAMQPVLARQLRDGTYEITVDSSSSMFRIVKCVLTVENGTMTADMTMSGQGYGFVFLGTGEEAAQAAEGEKIPFTLDAEGAKVFPVPVTALNEKINCAAWSLKKETWYDRELVFRSDLLPQEAFLEG